MNNAIKTFPLIVVSKLIVRENEVEIAKFFGLLSTSIPKKNIASVHKKAFSLYIETSGGVVEGPLYFWGGRKAMNEAVKVIK